MRTVVVDGIQVQAEDAAASAIEKLVSERDGHKLALDTANAKINGTVTIGEKTIGACDSEAFQAIVLAKDKEIAELKKEVMTPEARDSLVKDWAQLLIETKKLLPEFATDGKTCDAIRREVITTICGADEAKKRIVDAIFCGKDAEASSNEQVLSAFAMLKGMDAEEDAEKEKELEDEFPENNSTEKKTADALLGKDNQNTPTKLVGRDAWIDRQQNPEKYKED